MAWTEHLTEEQYKKLRDRVGEAHLKKRLSREAEHNILQLAGHGFQINWESMPWLFDCLKFFLKTIGLLERGKQNATEYDIVTQKINFKNLPTAFHGYRILHLSDLHLDAIPDRAAKLKETLKFLDYDLCVLTGDFRFDTIGPFSIMVKRVEDLLSVIKCKDGVYGILGNHDFIEMVPWFEDLGMKVLLNESLSIQRGKEEIFLAGVDDQHFYEAADLEKATQNIPVNKFKILLAHSQELIRTAAEMEFDYYLCGHTHGGQVCLPGGMPILTNTGFSKRYLKGYWRCKEMQGYTSRGTGSSGLTVRFHCPPEITLHILS